MLCVVSCLLGVGRCLMFVALVAVVLVVVVCCLLFVACDSLCGCLLVVRGSLFGHVAFLVSCCVFVGCCLLRVFVVCCALCVGCC